MSVSKDTVLDDNKAVETTHTRIEILRFVCASNRISGDRIGGVTPVPIPNTEVKPSTADGTAWVTAWESR